MNTAIRFPIAFVLGFLFSAGLFWSIWVAVSGSGNFGELKQATKIDFTVLRRDTETETKREKVVQPKPQKLPDIPQISSTASGIDSAGGVSVATPTFDTTGMGQISVGSDRDVIPLVRINPEYPQRARSRGIEGWVQVEFTISPAGTVADAKVVDADPKGLFEKAALEAIGRWKYNPKVVDGRAMERRGVGVVLTFKLEK
jgi:protein TonB